MAMQDRHVLIVEDSATDVNVLQVLLKRLGVSYTVFYDSRNAIDMLDDLPIPDAIFLDLEIPGGVSGYEVLEILQADPDFRNVPVVAYTSKLDEMTASREAGFHSFLGKPLKNERFGEQLAKIFDRIPVWDGR